MTRPLRLQFPGAIYHVMARGNARQLIFLDDDDRRRFLKMLSDVSLRLHWRLVAFCLMDNHYHCCVETRESTLARGMGDLNSMYAQSFNRRHDRCGHLFQGRYRAILVQRPSYVLEVIRYIVNNPVRSGQCDKAEAWKWSSHRAMIGAAAPLPSHDVSGALAYFREPGHRPMPAYRQFVAADTTKSLDELDRHPLVLGTETFAEGALDRVDCQDAEVSRRQRVRRSLLAYERDAQTRDEAIRSARASGTYSLAAIGRHFGLHYSTISHICRGI